MLRRVFTSILILGVALISAQDVEGSHVYHVISGDSAAGNVQGGTDPLIHFLAGPQTGSIIGSGAGGVFDASDFTSARHPSGSQAHVLGTTVKSTPQEGINPAWKPQLAGSPTAQWISTDADGGVGRVSRTALYAQEFTHTGPTGPVATLDFSFLVDNDLGDATNGGLYLNGTALSPSVLTGSNASYYQSDQSLGTYDITGLLMAGTNHLYVYTVNTGGPSGVQWDATITVVPEPTSFALFGLALVGFARRRR